MTLTLLADYVNVAANRIHDIHLRADGNLGYLLHEEISKPIYETLTDYVDDLKEEADQYGETLNELSLSAQTIGYTGMKLPDKITYDAGVELIYSILAELYKYYLQLHEKNNYQIGTIADVIEPEMHFIYKWFKYKLRRWQ